MKSYKLIYKIGNKIVETLVNQGNKQLCQFVKTNKLKTGNYKLGKLKIISTNGLKYNEKFKY